MAKPRLLASNISKINKKQPVSQRRKELDVSIDRSDYFFMVLPDNEMFNNFDLVIDQSDDIRKVETGE